MPDRSIHYLEHLNGSYGFGLGIGVIQTQKFDFEYLDPNFES